MSFYPVVDDSSIPYDVNTLLNTLSGYDSSQGSSELLDLSRSINESGNYFWTGAVFPAIAQVPVFRVPALNTINGSIQLPPGTFVVSISHKSDMPEGIKFKLYDKGTKASIFYGDYALASLVAGNEIELPLNEPFGPGYLLSPFIITPPGVLNWELTNLSGESALIQVLCSCAVPINNQSLNTREIKK